LESRACNKINKVEYAKKKKKNRLLQEASNEGKPPAKTSLRKMYAMACKTKMLYCNRCHQYTLIIYSYCLESTKMTDIMQLHFLVKIKDEGAEEFN
jgi:uncharacterized protein YnzC (UPF0291/DUF896 family)